MAIKFAYVVFSGDRQLPYVVHIDDIADLPSPRSANDFKKDFKYSIKWDRSDVATGKMSDFYPGTIKCLGATTEEILEKVKVLKLKTPSMSLLLTLPSADDLTDMDDTFPGDEGISCASHTPSAQKSAVQNVNKMRMKSALRNIEKQQFDQKRRVGSGNCSEGIKPKKISEPTNPLKRLQKDTSVIDQTSKKSRDAKNIVSSCNKDNIQKSRSVNEHPSSGRCKDRVQGSNIRKSLCDAKNIVSSCSNDNIQKSRSVNEHPSSAQGKDSNIRKSHENTNYESTVDKVQSKEVSRQCGKGIGNPIALKEPMIGSYSGWKKQSCSLTASTFENEAGGQMKAMVSSVPESKGTHSGNQYSEILLADVLEFGNLSEGLCEIVFAEAVEEEKISEDTAVSCESTADYDSDEEAIVDRISKAIKGEKPLMSCGEKVYIGRGVMVNKETWEKRMVCMKKDSLFCNDLTRLVWGKQTMAVRSLEGTKTKGKATPKKREICEAVFKGRLKARGITDPTLVNVMVDNTCKPAMKNAFYEASRVRKSVTAQHDEDAA